MKSFGAVHIAGPKFCGKSTTSSLFVKSIYRINTKVVVALISLNPKIARVGETPHLIDEWQKVPGILSLHPLLVSH